MPEEILVMILCILPMKDAVVTSSLSTRWRFLWRGVNQLDFRATTKYHLQQYMGVSELDRVSVIELNKYINQVNSVIQIYNLPKVQDFRIHYGFNCLHKGFIDEWLQFAVNKKVEFLQLDFKTCKHEVREQGEIYDFPSRLFEKNLLRPNTRVIELVSLKTLILKRVNVTETILQEFLTNSPYLETITIHDSPCLNNIHVGGRALNLKHFEIDGDCYVKSIYLSDFDLVSFKYEGSKIDLRLKHLPELKKLKLIMFLGGAEIKENIFRQISYVSSSLQSLKIYGFGQEKSTILDSFPELPILKKLKLSIWFHRSILHWDSIVNACPNVQTFVIEDQEVGFRLEGHGLVGQLSSCASCLQTLSISIKHRYKGCDVKFDFFPELPNVKKLRLTAYGSKYNYLMDIALILNACPNLETFTIQPLWTSTTLRTRNAKKATIPHKHLKVVEIVGYYGRNCDFELAAYIIRTAVELKKIVIDTRLQDRMRMSIPASDFSQNKEAARFAVNSRIKPILSQGVELVIL